MARVVYGALVTSMHGAIGGTVFQGGNRGNVARNKGMQALTLGERQQEGKRRLIYCTQYWKTMSAAQRADFSTFATTYPQYDRKTGTRQLSGYEVFLLWNLFRLSIGDAIQPNVAIVGLTLPTIAPTVDEAGGVLTINLHESASEPDAAWAYFISNKINPSINNPGSRQRWIVSTATDAGNVNITAAYTAVYGSIPLTGDTIIVDAKPYGIIDPFVYARQRFKIVVT